MLNSRTHARGGVGGEWGAGTRYGHSNDRYRLILIVLLVRVYI